MSDSSKDITNKKYKWPEDKLNRVESADFLTKYLNSLYSDSSEDIYLDSFVLNLNAEWGFGKSFFLRHWSEDLKNLKHPVVFFDAWENDFSDDPLLAFIAELEDSLRNYTSKIPQSKKLIEKTLSAAKHAIAPTIGILLNAASKKITGESLDNLTAAISGEKISELVDESIKSHNAKKEAIYEFKGLLVNLVNALQESNDFKLPMYIFIDELDRCKPTYAIELLEGIKHIFGVRGIYFIIATNKSQLVHSISAVYGSMFDASGYLKRFFDQEYILPKPNNESFSEYLIKEYRLGPNSNFFTPVITKDNDLKENVKTTFSLLSSAFNLSLRDQKQVFRQFKAIILSSKLKKIHILYLMFLIMMKHKNEEQFFSLINTSSKEEAIKILYLSSNLNVMFNGTVSVTYSYGPSEKVGSVSLLKVIAHYKSFDKLNALDIKPSQGFGSLANIQDELRKESPSSYKPDKYYELSISTYPELVCQAGQLLDS